MSVKYGNCHRNSEVDALTSGGEGGQAGKRKKEKKEREMGERRKRKQASRASLRPLFLPAAGRHCPLGGRISPTQLILLEIPSQTCAKACLSVDPKSDQTDNQDLTLTAAMGASESPVPTWMSRAENSLTPRPFQPSGRLMPGDRVFVHCNFMESYTAVPPNIWPVESDDLTCLVLERLCWVVIEQQVGWADG